MRCSPSVVHVLLAIVPSRLSLVYFVISCSRMSETPETITSITDDAILSLTQSGAPVKQSRG